MNVSSHTARDPLKPHSDPAFTFPEPDQPVGAYYMLRRQGDKEASATDFGLGEATPDHTFEIGLALGGTVSAGCYTAGVLDFLITALDAWTLAKDDPARRDVPRHNVRLKILTGTSGGGVNAMLMARALGFGTPATPNDDGITNLLRDVWVDKIDIVDLLATGDLDGTKPVSSLLCGNCLDAIARAAARFSGAPLGCDGHTPKQRDYVDPDLPVVLTLTNLRGVQYSSRIRGLSNRSEFFVDHADHLRFLVNVTGADQPDPPAGLHPYETWINYTAADGDAADGRPWDPLVAAALGTAAFPVGLPPRVICRAVQQYRYRYAIQSTADGERQAMWLHPEWRYLIAEGSNPAAPYQFLAVDGGVFDDEPVAFARDQLDGILGTSEPDGSKAKRAVILVDPFAEAAKLGPDTDEGILGTAGATLSALVSGGRYLTSDLALFAAENVYSRFLVNPVRADPVWATPRATGGDAIASAGLGAFMGFMSRSFRVHDFELGRRNCQQFLRAHFTLKADNPLFLEPAGSAEDRPIIPLVDAAAVEIAEPKWPFGAFEGSRIRDAVKARLLALGNAGTAEMLADLGGTWAELIRIFLWFRGEAEAGKAADRIARLIDRELVRTRLLKA